MSSSARRRRFLSSLCLAPVLALGTCTKKQEPVTPGGDGAAAAAPEAPLELAPVEHPSQLLPRDATLLITARSVARAAEVFERDRLVETFRAQYTSISSAVRGVTGHDLLDPAVWPTVGLDPEGLLGVAMLNAVDGQPVLFATIKDRVKLIEFIRTLAGKAEAEVVQTPYGAATVLRIEGQSGAVLMRDRQVAFVTDEGDLNLAERLVTMDPNVSLASRVGYRKATGGLRAADLTLYVDALSLVEQQIAEAESQAAEPQRNWAQEELVEAQKRGDPPERLAQLERQAQQENERQKEWRVRDEAERALTGLVVSGIEGVGLTVTVKRGGPIFDGRIVAGDDAFLRRLLSNRQGPPRLTQAMNGAPLFCLSGKAEAEAALELMEGVAAMEGQSASAFFADLQARSGIDLRAELPALMAGASEMCWALERPFDPRDKEPTQSLGMGAVIEVSDEAKAKYLLAKVANAPGKLAQRMKKQGEGYVIGVEDWRDLYAQPSGNRIVLSTDRDLAQRLAAGTPGSMPSKIRPAAARGAIELPNTAASEAFDLSTGFLWLMASRMSFEAPIVVPAGLTQEEMEAVPLSKKSKKAKKALDKATARVQALESEREAEQMQQVMKVMDPLGMVVAAATEDERGFTITGGQFLRVTSMGAVVEGIVSATLAEAPQPTPAEQTALEKAWESRNEANQAYIDARLQDAERYLAKKGKGKGQAKGKAKSQAKSQ
ncbi:MAG: hypothetical protein AAGF11_13690 [Myxococcota bacterium]